MFVKIKLLLFFIALIPTCTKDRNFVNDMHMTCGSHYATSDIYFEEDTKLTFRLRIVYFADSLNEPEPSYDTFMMKLNTFFSSSDISFKLVSKLKHVDGDIKTDMPSFNKYHFKHFKNDSFITMYIFSSYQPHYAEDLKNVAGTAGGLGSNFFAIRSSFLNTITPLHEAGHCFSLLHTNTYDESETGYTIYSGDKVCDSRKVEDYNGLSDMACNYTGSEELSDLEKKEIVCNFMSYNYMHCRGCITEGQIRRMRFYIHESPVIKLAIIKGLNKDIPL